MYLSEAVSSGPEFFALVPWIVFFPFIGLLINMIFGGMMLKAGGSDEEGLITGEKLVGGVASAKLANTFSEQKLSQVAGGFFVVLGIIMTIILMNSNQIMA